MDWDKIEQLLGIGKAAAEHGPKYTPIVSAVQAELEEHVEAAKKLVADKTKVAEEEAGRQRAEAANKARQAEQEAHDKIQADAQQAADRAEKLRLEEEDAAKAEGNIGDAAPETTSVRRV